jgi:hypothetical protein
MFTFFKGSIDELLESVAKAPESEVARITDENTLLQREEAIAMVIEDFKVPREQAERIVSEIQMEEFHRIAKGMVEDGLLEITGYDDDGPVYAPVKK